MRAGRPRYFFVPRAASLRCSPRFKKVPRAEILFQPVVTDRAGSESHRYISVPRAGSPRYKKILVGSQPLIEKCNKDWQP